MATAQGHQSAWGPEGTSYAPATTPGAWGPGGQAPAPLAPPPTTYPAATLPANANTGITGKTGQPVTVLVPPGPGKVAPSHKFMDVDGPYRPTKSLLSLMPILLLLILGFSAAPLSGYYKGWAYYRQKNYVVRQLGPTPFTMKVWVGYIKGSDTVRLIQHQVAPARYSQYRMLKDESRAAQILGGIECGLLGLSCLFALFYFAMYVKVAGNRGSARPIGSGLFPIAMLCSTILLLCTIALYIVMAIGVAHISERELGDRLIPWPDWCWFVALGASLFWGLLGLFSLRESLRQRAYSRASRPNTAPLEAGVPYAGTPAVA